MTRFTAAAAAAAAAAFGKPQLRHQASLEGER